MIVLSESMGLVADVLEQPQGERIGSTARSGSDWPGM
jgi:hypothetical protein